MQWRQNNFLDHTAFPFANQRERKKKLLQITEKKFVSLFFLYIAFVFRRFKSFVFFFLFPSFFPVDKLFQTWSRNIRILIFLNFVVVFFCFVPLFCLNYSCFFSLNWKWSRGGGYFSILSLILSWKFLLTPKIIRSTYFSLSCISAQTK